jgi:hypothetical protein
LAHAIAPAMEAGGEVVSEEVNISSKLNYSMAVKKI